MQNTAMSNNLFFDCYDWELKPVSEIKHDKVVRGNPAGCEFFRSVKYDFLVDTDNQLWNNIEAVNILFKDFRDSIPRALDVQDVIMEKEILTAQNKTFTYQVGEIELECLVKYHKSDEYYSCLNTIHKHNSVGNIVGLRMINFDSLIPKFQYRSSTNVTYWDLYPDQISTGRLTRYEVKVGDIKKGDVFLVHFRGERLKVTVINGLNKFPLAPDVPDQIVWIQFEHEVPGMPLYIEVNDLIPLD